MHNQSQTLFSLTAPSPTSDARCGVGYANAFVNSTNLGLSSHTFNWYDSPNGGTLLQSGGPFQGSVYNGLWSGQTLYASEIYGSYESPRTPVTTIIQPPLGLTATSSVSTGCTDQLITLGFTQETGAYTYFSSTWTANPWLGSGIPSSGITVTSQQLDIQPTLTGRYVYYLYAYANFSSCGALSQVTVDFVQSPTIQTSLIEPICPGESITLSANSSNSLTYIWTSKYFAQLTGRTQTITPVLSDDFTVTGYDANGCSTSQIVSVTILSAPPMPSANNGSDICGFGYSDAMVSTNSEVSSPVFIWYDSPTGGIMVQSGSTSYLQPLTASTTFYVSERNSMGCEGPRVMVHTEVAPADAIQISGDNAITLGSSASLSVDNIDNNNNAYTDFVWSVDRETGSGVINDGSTTGQSISITPTTANIYRYTVIATDPDKGCSNTTSFSVTVS